MLFLFVIRFGSELYKPMVGVQMCVGCATLVVVLSMLCYENDIRFGVLIFRWFNVSFDGN